MEFSGTWWGSMGLGGTQWNLVGLTILMKKKKYQCTSAKDIKPPSLGLLKSLIATAAFSILPGLTVCQTPVLKVIRPGLILELVLVLLHLSQLNRNLALPYSQHPRA